MPVIAKRLTQLPEYVFAKISREVRAMQDAGIDIIRMDIGSPDLPPPDFVLDALNSSARKDNHHGYSGYSGIPRFREGVARYYRKRFEVDLNPNTEILPLIGSKEGIINLILAYVDSGDIALVPEIGYPSYAMGTTLAGGDVCYISMPADKGFLLDLDSIPPDVARKAKILWCNYPNNPTGAIADKGFYGALVQFCKEYDIVLASDNPYCDVAYDGYRAPSLLEIDGAKDVAVEFMSMSKTFNMAGWRLGAAVGNADILKNLLKVKSNVDSGHFIPAYDAGIKAMDDLTDEWLAERNAIYQARRDVVMAGLDDVGLSAVMPKASLYIWARSEDMPALDYVNQARDHAHVSLAPGAAYGPGGDDYIRISVTNTADRLQEGMERLKAWYNNR
ncbi:MAG: aminotransferase class I/II-fold pyridoxal phosphate-dependent enzyme [Chloroflexota bacterium]